MAVQEGTIMGNPHKGGGPEPYEAVVGRLVVNRLRIVGAVGTVLMLLFSRLDAVVYPGYWLNFLYLRFAVCSVFLFVVFLSFRKAASRHACLLGDVLVLAAGFGIALMI